MRAKEGSARGNGSLLPLSLLPLPCRSGLAVALGGSKPHVSEMRKVRPNLVAADVGVTDVPHHVVELGLRERFERRVLRGLLVDLGREDRGKRGGVFPRVLVRGILRERLLGCHVVARSPNVTVHGRKWHHCWSVGVPGRNDGCSAASELAMGVGAARYRRLVVVGRFRVPEERQDRLDVVDEVWVGGFHLNTALATRLRQVLDEQRPAVEYDVCLVGRGRH